MGDGMRVARNAMRGIGAVAIFTALLLAGAGAMSHLSGSSAQFTFHCVSSAGSSDTTYSVTGSAPATVTQGDTFTLSDVVITGTPAVPLLIKHVDFVWSVTPNATPVGSFELALDGPGALVPPGPPAPAGVPNSSSPQSYQFVASGAPGTQIDFGVSQVVADVLNPNDTAQEIVSTCSYVSGGPFASTVIAAAATSTTSTDTLPATTASTSTSTSTTSTAPTSTAPTSTAPTSSTSSSTSTTTTPPGSSSTVVTLATSSTSSPVSGAGGSVTTLAGGTSSTVSASAGTGANSGALPFTGSGRAPLSLAWMLLVGGLALVGAGSTRRRA